MHLKVQQQQIAVQHLQLMVKAQPLLLEEQNLESNDRLMHLLMEELRH
jgi:hypothetical protein